MLIITLHLKIRMCYIYYISNLFLLESYEFTNLKNNSLFMCLDGIILTQSKKEKA